MTLESITLLSLTVNLIVMVAVVSFAASGHWATWKDLKSAADAADSSNLVVLSKSEYEESKQKLSTLAAELDTWVSETEIKVTRLDTIESRIDANNVELLNACDETCVSQINSRLEELANAAVQSGEEVRLSLTSEGVKYILFTEGYPGKQNTPKAIAAPGTARLWKIEKSQ